jgi:hypothetical protein
MPTLIEAYERDSDYRRWRAGMEMWFGDRGDWVTGQAGWLARLKLGPISDIIPLTTTLFPSKKSGESAWHVTARPRGAILLPMPLQAGQLTLDRGPENPAEHRLIYDVRGIVSRDRLGVWTNLIGDQFEDSATTGEYPEGLIEDPVDALAFTLVEVDVAGFRLIFDLSRPFVRRRVSTRTYWKLAPYDPRAPMFWQSDGSRHLASSHRFECSCPDYQGRVISDLQSIGASMSDRFPIPGAGRDLEGAWEGYSLGYAKKWRDLDVRADRRRECKHIHSVRWAAEVPFDEPTDSPRLGSEAEGRLLEGAPPDFEEAGKFYGEQLLTYDRLLLGVAPLIGLNLDADGELRGQAPTFRPVNRPILWNDPEMPDYSWCRQNDWWLPRGKAEAWLFDPPSGGFVKQLDGGDVLERVPIVGDSLDIPLIIGPPQRRIEWVTTGRGALALSLRARKDPKGSLVGTGGLGRSRLVMDANLQVTFGGTGELQLLGLTAFPVADLAGPLSGIGRFSVTRLHSNPPARLSGRPLAGSGGLGAPVLFARPPAVLTGRLAGAGGLPGLTLFTPVRRVLAGSQSGTGGMALGLSSRPPSDYFGDWVEQNYGVAGLGLIEWWGN